MTAPCLTYEEFRDLLNRNGWEIVCGDYWNDHNRIIFQKDGHSFPLQYKKVYFFPIVVRTCLSLEIEPPEECLRVYNQIKQRDKESSGNKDN